LDNGPAISYLQSGYALDYRLFEAIVAFANQKGILYQLKGRTVGGTDGTRLASTYFGVPCAGVNIPSRYIHSPVSMISKKDFENTKQFIADILTEEILLKALEVKV